MRSLELILRRSTKIIAGLENLPYEERLQTLVLPSLFYRRQRGKMIHTFKIMSNLVRIEPSTLFEAFESTYIQKFLQSRWTI